MTSVGYVPSAQMTLAFCAGVRCLLYLPHNPPCRIVCRRGRRPCASLSASAGSLGASRSRLPSVIATDITVPIRLRNTRKFVVLSDLHVRPESLDTCLQILRKTHETAQQRNAGVLFCGDFWHTRGSIPVGLLHHVLRQIAEWTCPVILVPGNHDMYSRHENEQALTPLATTLGAKNCVLVTAPSVFMNALFLPYTPRVDHFCDALQCAAALPDPPSTVFCHAEIAGARLSGSLISPVAQDIAVVQPAHFARFQNLERVYSGHLHRPHSIPNTNITYVGSPYQVTAAEAGQEKSLLVLDAHCKWTVVEAVPIDIGPRHYHFRFDEPGQNDPAVQARNCRPGDRVIVFAPSHLLKAENVSNAVSSLRALGARVRVQQTISQPQRDSPSQSQLLTTVSSTPASSPGGNQLDAGEPAPAPASPEPRLRDGSVMTPLAVFESYARTKSLPPDVLELGLKIVQSQARSSATQNRDTSGFLLPIHLKWLGCKLTGFGSFLHSVEYSFKDRGVVVVTGRDEGLDDSSNRSNGAGKSTLCLASLWALTGYLGGRTATLEVVHDDALLAEVCTDILISGERVELFARKHNLDHAESNIERLLVVKRTSRKRDGKPYKQTLEVALSGKDLTCLDIRLTQRLLDDLLQPTILSHTTFFNEHAPGILNSTDTELKRMLSLLFPIDIWSNSRMAAQREANEYSNKASRAQSAAEASKSLVLQLTESVKYAQNQVQTFENDRAHRLDKCAEESRAVETRLTQAREELGHAEACISTCSPDDLLGLREDIENCEKAIENKVRSLSQLQSARKVWEYSKAIFAERHSALSKAIDEAKNQGTISETIINNLETAFTTLSFADHADGDDRTSGSSSDTAECPEQLDGNNLTRAMQNLNMCIKEMQKDLLSEQIHYKYLCEREETSKYASNRYPMVCEQCLSPFDGSAHEHARQQLQKEIAVLSEKIRQLEQDTALVRRAYDLITPSYDEDSSYLFDKQNVVPMQGTWRRRSDELESFNSLQQTQEEELGRFRRNLDTMRTELRVLNEAWESAEEVKEKCEKLRHEIRELEFCQSEVRHRMQEMKRERNPHLSSVVALRSEADSSAAHAKCMEMEGEMLQTQTDAARALDVAFGPRGVQNFILEAGLAQLEARTDNYLHALSGGELFARFKAYSEYKNSKRGNGDVSEIISKAVYVKRKDGEFACRGLRQLSSGQFRRVDLACSLAFAELCREQGHHSSSMLVMDEGLRYLDQEGRRCFAKLLLNLPYETILVVSHEEVPEIASIARGVDVCVRNNDCSQVIVDSRFQGGDAIGNDVEADI